MKNYMYKSLDPENFKVINQTGVKQACFPLDGTPYNACWDGFLAPDGRVYVPAATEDSIGEYVKLCEYKFDENSFTDLFYGKDVFMAPERAITSSKFHFSIDVMEDGRIIAASHTTDKAPSHPIWLYKQYYYHMWEGYPGSSLVIYDPKTNKVEHLGVITPRETIYGGVYNQKDKGYYCLGYLKGHLYRYSLKTKRLTDFGKVTEWQTFRLHTGPDGNIYGASKSGFLFKLDINTDEIIDLNFEISHNTGGPGDITASNCKSMAGTVNIPNSTRFLFTVFGGEGIYSHDTAVNKTEFLGRLLSADEYCESFRSRECAYSLKFDNDNVLWYPLTCYPFIDLNGDYSFRRAASLMRWDILKGGQPECLGVIGTPCRANATVPSLMLDNKRDIMYLIDTNHGSDGMSLLAIDMRKFKPRMYEKGPGCVDSFLIQNHPRYMAMTNASMAKQEIERANNPDFVADDIIPVRLWRSCRAENSKVIGLAWKDENTVCGICGDNKMPQFAFKISIKGEILEFISMDKLEANYKNWLLENILPAKPELNQELDLPYHSGRQYKAVPNADAEWNNGRKIIGTLDGLLAIVDGENVFSLGPAAPNGPIHCLTTNKEKTVCYGVAGDPEDLGMIFRYDDKKGLRQLGKICYNKENGYGPSASNELSSIVMNKKGDKIAVGSNDRLGVVYIVTLN